MSFPAKFGGTCAKCAGYIPAGALVNYDGGKIRHAPRCPAKGTVTEVPEPPKQEERPITEDTKILGKAEYKGKEYLILWRGTTRAGKESARLMSRDGKLQFWADESAIRIVKVYEEDEDRYGRTRGGMTWGKLQRLREEFTEQKAAKNTAAKEQAKRAALKPDQRLAQIDEILARAGRVRATRDDGVGPVTEAQGFSREGKDAPQIGEIVTSTRKGKGKAHYVVVSVSAPEYLSRKDCEDMEDMDIFDAQPGWRVSYEAIRVTPTAEEEDAAVRLAADKEEAKNLQAALSGSLTHIGYTAPNGVTMADLWNDRRMAGSENWYLGGDGVVYRMVSDYDMGPSWARSSATPEMIARAKELGLKP